MLHLRRQACQMCPRVFFVASQTNCLQKPATYFRAILLLCFRKTKFHFCTFLFRFCKVNRNPIEATINCGCNLYYMIGTCKLDCSSVFGVKPGCFLLFVFLYLIYNFFFLLIIFDVFSSKEIFLGQGKIYLIDLLHAI